MKLKRVSQGFSAVSFLQSLETAPGETRPAHTKPIIEIDSQGMITALPQPERSSAELWEALSRLYEVLANKVVINHSLDMNFGASGLQQVALDETSMRHGIARASTSYASAILLPVLNFVVGRIVLIKGGPGQGKTQIVTALMYASGMDPEVIKECLLQCYPGRTYEQLVGIALPKSLMEAEGIEDFRIAWLPWTRPENHVIGWDEVNRLDRDVQGATLTALGDRYLEVRGQVTHIDGRPIYMTANDEGTGGVQGLIEPLIDRIDVHLRMPPMAPAGIDIINQRIAKGQKPLDVIPDHLRFTPAELKRMKQDVRALPLDPTILDRLMYFWAQTLFCGKAAPDDYGMQNKDHAIGNGWSFPQFCDKCAVNTKENLCSTVTRVLSARPIMPILEFARAAAFFNGDTKVDIAHLTPLLPPMIGPKFDLNGENSEFWRQREFKPWVSEEARRHIDKAASLRRLWLKTNEFFDRDVKNTRKSWADAMERFCRGFDVMSVAEAQALEKELWQLLNNEKNLKAGHNPYIYFVRLQLADMHNKTRSYIHWKQQNPDGR